MSRAGREESDVLSRRERAKRAKRRRITRAAAELFRAKGYDAVTTDEIAERADVAKGTVFRYAPTKARLLLLVYEDGLEEAVDEGFGALDAGTSVVDQLVSIFTRFFRLYAEDTDLARRFIQEMMFLPAGEGRELHGLTERFLVRLAGLIERWRAEGRVPLDVDPGLAARTTFALYFAVLVSWLNGQLPAAVRDDLLVRSLRLHWRGLTRDA